MDKAYLAFRDLLIRTVMDEKLIYISLGKPVSSADPVVANQIAASLTCTAYRRPPVNRKGQLVLEG